MDIAHCIGATCASVQIGKDHYRTEIKASGHLIIADEPIDIGGMDEGMNPNELLLSSLGACTAITLRMYADRKAWPVDNINVSLTLDIVRSGEQHTTFIKRHISIKGEISDDQRQRMLQIADSCPLHKIMMNPVVITSNLVPSKD